MTGRVASRRNVPKPSCRCLVRDAPELHVHVGRTPSDAQRPDDFRPPPDPAKRQTDDANANQRRRTSTVAPVFGILEPVLGCTRFHRRGLAKVNTEWQLLTLADDWSACTNSSPHDRKRGADNAARRRTHRHEPTDC